MGSQGTGNERSVSVARTKTGRSLLLFVLGLVCPTASAVEVTDLGTLGGGQSFALAINDFDQVAGVSWTASGQNHSFFYGNGQMTDSYPFNSQLLITVQPHGINNLGQLSGGIVATDGNYYPAIHDSQGSITILGSFGGVTSYGFAGVATAINNSGQTVGYSYLDSVTRHAFIYHNGVMQDISCVPCDTIALDTNDQGQVVGSSGRAFLYSNGVMTDISPFGSSQSYARAINNRGQIVGEYLIANHTAEHAFIYSDGIFTDIGQPNSPMTVAYDINEDGVVVGATLVSDALCRGCGKYKPQAFVYENGVMTNLNTLLPTGSGWSLAVAFAINNNRKIVGYGLINGQSHAFMLSWSQAQPSPTPIPIPTPTPTPPSPVCDLTEAFDAITTLASRGWVMQNNSRPGPGTTGWFQGSATVFPSQACATDSYVAANFNNGTATSTLSNWLLTPPVYLNNGGTFSFRTRTVADPTFPDRLQVRMSTNGSSQEVGSTATGVGDFTTLLLDINPTYTLTGYPDEWTQFTVTLNGLVSPTTGRLAFRYFLENGGPNGTTSDYIGIDTVQYACNGPTPTPTPTPGSIGYVRSATAESLSPVSSQTIPLGTITSGDMIFLVARIGNASVGSVTATDGLGNTYAAIQSQPQGANSTELSWYAKNVIGGFCTISVSWTGSSGNFRAIAVEYSGLSTVAPLDQNNKAQSSTNGTAINAGNVTTTVANELIITTCHYNANAVLTAGSGYTVREQAGYRLALEDKIASSVGTYAGDGTACISVQWASMVSTFRHASAPVPTPTASVSISGNISYCADPAFRPVSNVTLHVAGDTTTSTLSDVSGHYTLSSLFPGGHYTVTPAKAGRAPGSAGISTVDVIATQRHFLSVSPLPLACARMAADVNEDGYIDTIDIIGIQRFDLGLSAGVANVGQYRFTPASRTYSGIAGDQTGQNYNALILGDVAAPFVEP